MSPAAWVRSQRERPITDNERCTAMGAVLVLLCAAALLLTLTRPRQQPHPARPAARGLAGNPAVRAPARRARSLVLTPGVVRAVRVFLAGYLGYLYGHTTAGEIKDATPGLLRSLQQHPPRQRPSTQPGTTRLLALHGSLVAPGVIGVRALLSDGGLIRYTIELRLVRHGARLLTSGLDGA